jgi:hypothetical protein
MSPQHSNGRVCVTAALNYSTSCASEGKPGDISGYGRSLNSWPELGIPRYPQVTERGWKRFTRLRSWVRVPQRPSDSATQRKPGKGETAASGTEGQRPATADGDRQGIRVPSRQGRRRRDSHTDCARGLCAGGDGPDHPTLCVRVSDDGWFTSMGRGWPKVRWESQCR